MTTHFAAAVPHFGDGRFVGHALRQPEHIFQRVIERSIRLDADAAKRGPRVVSWIAMIAVSCDFLSVTFKTCS